MALDTKESVLQGRLKDRDVIMTAAHRMDEFRRRYGKASKGFNTTALLRKLRDTR